MKVIAYNIFLLLFRAGIYATSLFNAKAKKWVQGRKNIFSRISSAIAGNEKIIWMHCASLGEFEQGRPLLETIKQEWPGYKILLTFFSPSGYEVQKEYKGADWVFYLPLDGPANARNFLEIVNPSLVIFVKYEFWYYYLKKIKYRNIPLLLVSALFRKNMIFFKWYGGLQRKMLSRFDHLFVQDEESKKIIDELGLGVTCTVAGDTRFDRVAAIASQPVSLPLIEAFVNGQKALVAGSTWPEDDEILHKTFSQPDRLSLKLIIAPHEISEKRLNYLKELFPDSVRFSELSAGSSFLPSPGPLIIDNVGMLSKLYQYGWCCYVGGGFKPSGIHNVLEAAVYKKIVLFGPYYHQYAEAIGLVKSGGGISFYDEQKDGATLSQLLLALANDKDDYNRRSIASGKFVQSQTGATQRIAGYIQENRLLTR